jgi:hypothetical protein
MIVGLNSVTRVDGACAIRGKVLTENEIKYLEEQYVPDMSGHSYTLCVEIS